MVCTVAALGVIAYLGIHTLLPDAAASKALSHLRPRIWGCLSYGRALWTIATYFLRGGYKLMR